MRRTSRLLITLSILLALAAAGYAALWHAAAQRVRDGLATWVVARKAEGYRISVGEPSFTGFPFAFHLRAAQPMIEAPGWRWTADAVEALGRPWDLRHIDVHPIGHQEARFPKGKSGESIIATTADAVARIEIAADGGIARVLLDAESLSLIIPGASAPLGARSAHASLARPTPPDQPASGLRPSVHATLELGEASLPETAAGPLGSQIHQLTVEGELLGTVPPGPIATSLAAWRDAGGTVELKSFDLAWGPLRISGNATVALDAAMQLEAAGTGRIRGYAETIDALVTRGLIKPRDGMFAKAGLGLLAKTPAEGGAKVLTVPLTIQKQMFYAGPVGLLRLAPIEWPE